jgi:hypothetical protein
MDQQRIFAIALGAAWIAGIVGAYIAKGIYNDVHQLNPRMSVAESRQVEFKRRFDTVELEFRSRFDAEKESIAKVLENIQKLVSEQQKMHASHDARLAVLEQSDQRRSVESLNMQKKMDTLLEISIETKTILSTFESVE